MSTLLNRGSWLDVDSWAEGLSNLDLQAARHETRKRQKEASVQRGAWIPLALPEKFMAHVQVAGAFAANRRWDEAAEMPWQDGAFAYPRIFGGKLEFGLCERSDLVEDAQLKIFQAPDTSPRVEPELIFVPCLLADRAAWRIGRGAGHYDRYLAEHPQVRAIGLCHSDYVLKKIPESWLHSGDRQLLGIVTESNIFIDQETLP